MPGLCTRPHTHVRIHAYTYDCGHVYTCLWYGYMGPYTCPYTCPCTRPCTCPCTCPYICPDTCSYTEAQGLCFPARWGQGRCVADKPLGLCVADKCVCTGGCMSNFICQLPALPWLLDNHKSLIVDLSRLGPVFCVKTQQVFCSCTQKTCPNLDSSTITDLWLSKSLMQSYFCKIHVSLHMLHTASAPTCFDGPPMIHG